MIELPEQTGVLLVAVGVAGIVLFTTTLVVAVEAGQPLCVTEAVYVPAFIVFANAITPVPEPDEKPAGPVIFNAVGVTVDVLVAVSFILSPTQTGELLVIVGGASEEIICMLTYSSGDVYAGLLATMRMR